MIRTASMWLRRLLDIVSGLRDQLRLTRDIERRERRLLESRGGAR